MKKILSLILSIPLMIMFVILGLRLMLSHMLLNEDFYHQLQQEVKLAETIIS